MATVQESVECISWCILKDEDAPAADPCRFIQQRSFQFVGHVVKHEIQHHHIELMVGKRQVPAIEQSKRKFPRTAKVDYIREHHGCTLGRQFRSNVAIAATHIQHRCRRLDKRCDQPNRVPGFAPRDSRVVVKFHKLVFVAIVGPSAGAQSGAGRLRGLVRRDSADERAGQKQLSNLDLRVVRF